MKTPEGWQRQTIKWLGGNQKDAVQTGPFGAQLHASDYVSEGVPFILIRNIGPDGLRLEGMPRIGEEDAERLKRYALRTGDVVFSRVGRVGSCFLAEPENEGWIISGQTLRVRVLQHHVSPQFLYWTLGSKHAQKHITGASVGSTRKSINTKILEGLEVLLPPLPEQRRIAEILGSVDESIRATKAVIEQTKKVKKGLLQQLLTRGIGHTRFKQTEIGEIPESWEVVRLDELATAPICYGIVQPGPSVASGVPMVAIRDMGRPLGIALHRASPDIEGKYVRSRVRQGDVLLSVKGTTGRVHEVADGFSGNISRDIARLRLSTPGITSFMAAFLQSVPGQKALEDITVGSTRAELSIKRLRRLLVPLAPDGERLRIGQMAKYYEKLELRQEKALLMLANCKTGLMQDLLTGKVRVKV